MTSRETSEYFMPSVPMEMPSEIVMVLKISALGPGGGGSRRRRWRARLVDVDVAGRDLAPGRGDADLRFGEILGLEADGVEHGTAGGALGAVEHDGGMGAGGGRGGIGMGHGKRNDGERQHTEKRAPMKGNLCFFPGRVGVSPAAPGILPGASLPSLVPKLQLGNALVREAPASSALRSPPPLVPKLQLGNALVCEAPASSGPSLVPKLQLGNALVCEVALRRSGRTKHHEPASSLAPIVIS